MTSRRVIEMKPVVLFAAMLMFASACAHAGELKTVESPRGASIRISVQQTSKTADTLVLLIPGGNGAGHIKVTDGKVELSKNFISRTAELYAEAGLISVLMDAPSDSIKGMSDTFRISDDHTRDVSAILVTTNKHVLLVPITSGFTPSGEDPCMPISVQGFYGADAEVTDRIIRWITTR